jgi:choline dehydrogenase-like flavoprotein
MVDPYAPAGADIVIIGGGTSGAALAGLLARDSQASVVLLEAGPDYGAFAEGGWPPELLDARRLPASHGWNYAGLAHASQPSPISFDRARVIGGCSSHNGCVALAGHRRDYDAWAELGNPGWDWASVAPSFERARTALRVRHIQPDEVSPFHGAFVEASVAAGLACVDDLDNPDGISEVGFSPVNIGDGVRWNTALAYLDGVRERHNLRIVGDALVERVEVVGGRAVAVLLAGATGPSRIQAQRIVLSAGAYGSPAVLLRSGIGAPDGLRSVGIQPVHVLPGVGRSLQDHPAVSMTFRGSSELVDRMHQWSEERWLPDEQALAKGRSRNCHEAFDIHLFSYAPALADGSGWSFRVVAACVAPRSVGSVSLASADPSVPPSIDHGFLTDPDGHDLAVLHDALELAQTVTANEPLSAHLVADELQPMALAGRVGIYFHPSCSCRMGPVSDPLAVVDAHARVHGLQNLYVCDASIFPRLMRANTNLPAAMLAERLAPVMLTSA